MSLLDKAGLSAYVGKVTMDRDAPNSLCEKTEETYANLENFIKETKDKYKNVHPIVTPRFIISCTDETSRNCAKLANKYNLPVQSHLSENKGEIQYVSELCPDSSSYTDAYIKRGLISKKLQTVMAHCVHLGNDEIKTMKDNNVFIAHCPQSNINICSGAAPISSYMKKGLKVGLGTDISAGANLEMECAIKDAISVSKLLFALNKTNKKPLKLSEAFYLASKGGGEFFGKVGSFEKEYDFDAVIIDDEKIKELSDSNLEQRIERTFYNYALCKVIDKYVAGQKIKLS